MLILIIHLLYSYYTSIVMGGFNTIVFWLLGLLSFFFDFK